MSTVKPNNYDQAKKEILAFGKEHGVDLDAQLPDGIKESDKGHYVVALIAIEQIPGTKRNKGRIVLQPYDRQSYEKIKKGVTHLGFDAAILMHNPTVAEVVESIQASQQAPAGKSEAELRKEIEDAAELKYEKKFNFKTNPYGADLSAMQDEDIELFADVNGIDLKGAKNLEEKKQIVSMWQIFTHAPATFNVTTLEEEDLKLFAKLNDIEIKKAKNKEEILTAITTWQGAKTQGAV